MLKKFVYQKTVDSYWSE